MANPYFVDESMPWFGKEAGWPEEVPKNYDFPRITLYEMLKATAEKMPADKAIWFLGGFMSFGELHDLVLRLANGLSRLGLKKGDVVALILPNSFQYVVSYYACQRLGLIVTGVNPTYKAGEVLHQLKIAGVKAVIALDALCQTMLAPILEKYPLEHVIVTSIVDLARMSPLKKWIGKKLKKIPTGPVPPMARQFRDLVKSPPTPPEVKVDADDVATYIMTGGTTGVPKAAMLSHLNCVANCIQGKLWLYKGERGSCCVGVLPLFHSFAMTCVMNVSIYWGAWMMLFPRPPETAELLKTICDIAPNGKTFYCGAEVLFQRIADLPDIANYPVAGKLVLCIAGAGPLHRPVQERFEKVTNARLVEGYGLTEASPIVSAGPFWGNRKIGTIGLPLTGTEWKIMDMATATKEMAVGENGEICAAGPQVMMGYLNQPAETAETVKEWGGKRWLLTGDIGFMDEYGRVTINDRKKQLIKVRGYSVFPKEIEELVGGHPSVQEVAAAGLPDREMGEAIKAWVVLRPEQKGKVTVEQLHAWCKENMTHYKVPRYIEFRDDLPKTLVGKVLRRELQETDPLYKEYYGKK